jgi:hypothetical protein
MKDYLLMGGKPKKRKVDTCVRQSSQSSFYKERTAEDQEYEDDTKDTAILDKDNMYQSFS